MILMMVLDVVDALLDRQGAEFGLIGEGQRSQPFAVATHDPHERFGSLIAFDPGRQLAEPLLFGVGQGVKLLQGAIWESQDPGEPEVILSAEEKAEVRRKRNRRHVWRADGNQLRAVEITIGLVDSTYSELVSGELRKGDQLVTGIATDK